MSKLVTPRWPISPSSRSFASSVIASIQPGCWKVHQWNCRRSILRAPSRSRRPLTAARTISGCHRPGVGHHLVKIAGRLPAGVVRAARGPHAIKSPGDLLGAAIVVGHVEAVEACLGIGGHVGGGAVEVERAPSLSMSATCHRPVTMRLIQRPGASSIRSGTWASPWGPSS